MADDDANNQHNNGFEMLSIDFMVGLLSYAAAIETVFLIEKRNVIELGDEFSCWNIYIPKY